MGAKERKKSLDKMSTSDCPGGNRNFNINSNAQQIVRGIAICKH